MAGQLTVIVPAALRRSIEVRRRREAQRDPSSRSDTMSRRGLYWAARLLHCETGADKLLIVTSKDVLIGKRGVRPANTAALGKLVRRRRQELRSADLSVALRRRLGGDAL